MPGRLEQGASNDAVNMSARAEMTGSERVADVQHLVLDTPKVFTEMARLLGTCLGQNLERTLRKIGPTSRFRPGPFGQPTECPGSRSAA